MPIDKEVQKEAIKEALEEWLEKQFATFGKWTLAGLISAAVAGATYLAVRGWVK